MTARRPLLPANRRHYPLWIAVLAVLLATVAVSLPSRAGAGQTRQAGPPGEIRFVGSNRLVTAPGTFHRWRLTQAEVNRADPRGVNLDLRVEVEIASIDTGNSRRDSHLRSADFFDAARYPTAQLRLYDTRLKAKSTAGVQRCSGKLDFSMHGRKRTYDVEFELIEGKQLEVRGSLTINRRDFGIGAPYQSLSLLSVYEPVSITYKATLPE